MSVASSEKTRSDYLLEKPRQKMPEMHCDFPGCDGVHKPNKETKKCLEIRMQVVIWNPMIL